MTQKAVETLKFFIRQQSLVFPEKISSFNPSKISAGRCEGEKNCCSSFSSFSKLIYSPSLKEVSLQLILVKCHVTRIFFLTKRFRGILNIWIGSVFDKATPIVLLKEDAVCYHLGKWILKIHPHLFKTDKKMGVTKSTSYNMLYTQIERLHLIFFPVTKFNMVQ